MHASCVSTGCSVTVTELDVSEPSVIDVKIVSPGGHTPGGGGGAGLIVQLTAPQISIAVKLTDSPKILKVRSSKSWSVIDITPPGNVRQTSKSSPDPKLAGIAISIPVVFSIGVTSTPGKNESRLDMSALYAFQIFERKEGGKGDINSYRSLVHRRG